MGKIFGGCLGLIIAVLLGIALAFGIVWVLTWLFNIVLVAFGFKVISMWITLAILCILAVLRWFLK